MPDVPQRPPNILLIMTDQMRGDCLSIAQHPAVLTPNIDEIGGMGTYFSRAYTTSASCIPARRALLTGEFPATNGMVGFVGGNEIRSRTFPELLRDAGYETALIGRNMHQHPRERDYGYETRALGSSYVDDDLLSAAIEMAEPDKGGMRAAGISYNGWTARPWPLDESVHPTTWVAQQAREFLDERSDERPLFMTASFYAPHPPLVPPAFYMDRYLRMDLPPAAIGDWAVPPPNRGLGAGIDAHRVFLDGEALRSAQAGYFGLINHIDDQLHWLIREFMRVSWAQRRPWVIAFTSDHGEMLGDHYYFRKCEPYEGSSRIPLLLCASPNFEFTRGQTCAQPVCLEDLMPTFLELAGLDIPEGLDGRSLVSTLRGGGEPIRDVLHGEHSPCYGADQAYHFVTDGRMKFIWRPLDGTEQCFDLEADPLERHDLVAAGERADEVAAWRERLVERLRHRPEGFVDGACLVAGRPYEAVLPHARR